MRRRLLALAMAAVAACGAPEPAPLVRVVGAEPAGAGVPPDAAVATVTFSGPVDPEGLLDGTRLVLAPVSALREALAAVSSDAGASGFPSAVTTRATLVADRTRVELVPVSALWPRTGYALVLGPARAADGRPVLDPDGRRRAFVATFETGDLPGPPPRPVLTEVRADAATPEAGGEYVEVANLGEGALALEGWRLGKRTATGALVTCTVTGGAYVAPGGLGLVVGGAYDGRYPLPADVPVFRCGATALLGGIANDRAPELSLLDFAGEVASTFGAGAVAPRCPAAVERIHPAGPDDAANLACAEGEGTPGYCNSVTPVAECAGR